MPQITLHHDCFDVRMEISSEAPTDVYRLADQLVKLTRTLVGKAAKAKLADRLRKELGPRGASGNRFGESSEVECPRCGSGAAYRKGTRPRTVEVPRLGTVEVERPYLECRQCGRSYVPYEAGAPERRRYGQAALRRPIEATMETSYRRGAEASSDSSTESPSARTLWRIVNEGPLEATEEDSEEQVPLDADAEAVRAPERTCVADATASPPVRKTPSIASRSLARSSPKGREGLAAAPRLDRSQSPGGSDRRRGCARS